MYSILFFCIYQIVVTTYTYIFFDKDKLSPSFLLNLSFSIGSIFLLCGFERLGVNDFDLGTFLYLIIVNLIFLVAEILVRLLLRHRISQNSNSLYKDIKNKKFLVSKYELVCFICILILTTIIQYLHASSYVVSDNIFEVASSYRNLKFVSNEVIDNGMVILAYRIITGLQPLVIFIYFFNKYIYGYKVKKVAIICGVGLYIFCLYMLGGARGKIFGLLIQMMIAFLMCSQGLDLGDKNIINFKKIVIKRIYLKLLLIIPLLITGLFYYGGILSGRDYSSITPIQSIENYFSYGFIRLDLLLTGKETIISDHFGHWSFPGVYGILNKVIGVRYNDTGYLPFYGNYGNTLTMYGRWFIDFGWYGSMICTFFISCFYSYIYYSYIYAKNIYEVIIYRCLYIFLAGNLIMACYDDWHKNVFTLNNIFQMMIICLASIYYVKKYLSYGNYGANE